MFESIDHRLLLLLSVLKQNHTYIIPCTCTNMRQIWSCISSLLSYCGTGLRARTPIASQGRSSRSGIERSAERDGLREDKKSSHYWTDRDGLITFPREYGNKMSELIVMCGCSRIFAFYGQMEEVAWDRAGTEKGYYYYCLG